MSTLASRREFRSALCALLLLWPGLTLGASTLRPLGDVQSIPLGRQARPYLVIQGAPVRIPVNGPGTVRGFVRVPMPTDAVGNRNGVLQVAGLGDAMLEFPLSFRPSTATTWPDGRPGNPSAGSKVTWEVPAGRHDLELTGTVPGGDPLLIILYYDGPDQPRVPGLQPQVVAPSIGQKSRKKTTPSWTTKGSAEIDFMYNDNILTNSQDYLDDFSSGSYPYKFIHSSDDDLVLAPGLRLEARRNFFAWGQTRFTFRFKHWLYTHNPIKTNTDFHFYGRQYFGKKKSLEAYFHFAPEQYIRQLSDRAPLDDPDSSINWTEFRFQRNVWNLTYRQTVNKKLAVKFLYEENYRYYNQPFMENDIEAWELRGNLAWKINRTYTLNLDYSFEDGDARGLDEVGENILTSDNSDASYERDLYRIGLTIKSRALRKYVRQIDFSFLFMDYYYTTGKSLADDPFHAGRRDTYYKATAQVRRKLTKTISAKAAVRRTQRVVYSPWEGDITTDKDFTQFLYWVNLSYSF